MQYTEKLGLKLPEGTDNYDIADMNFNSNKLDFLGTVKSADKIDRYIIPEFEQEGETGTVTKTRLTYAANRSITTYSSGNELNYIDVGYPLLDTTLSEPTLRIRYTDGTSKLIMSTSYFYTRWDNSDYTSASYLLKILQLTASRSNCYLTVPVNARKTVELVWDFKIPVSADLFKDISVVSYTSIGIYGSLDGINYTGISGNSFTNYRYIKLEINGTHSSYSGAATIYYFSFKNVRYQVQETVYHNKYTIDSDFTNIEDNQRILLQTPSNETTYTKLEEGTTRLITNDLTIDSNIKASGFCTSNTQVKVNVEASGHYQYNINNIFDGNDTSQYQIAHSSNPWLKITFDKPIKIKKIKVKGGGGSPISYPLSISINGYRKIDSFLSTKDIVLPDYLKPTKEILITLNDVPNFLFIYEFDIIEWEIYDETPPPYSEENIVSNTINDINIKDLLRFGQRYELTYNDNNNWFENKKILYDILLTENVSQIDFIGLLEKMEYGKIYTIILISTYTVGTITFGANNTSLFALNQYGEGAIIQQTHRIWKSGEYMNNVYVSYGDVLSGVQMEGYENIRITSSFPIGTRLIIKEGE